MMNLYSLTLLQPTAILKAVYGNFSGPKAQEIAVAKGKVLEILTPDENNSGKLRVVHSEEVFGIIRTINIFRLHGQTQDYIIVGSDSGRIVILKFNKEKGEFEKVHQETYGKTGCRRIVPGQYIAVDPKGRACMFAAIEKQKFVYILNRDNEDKLTISSPLEAHKSHTLCYDIIGIDVGYENSQFACIECDYGEVEQKDSAVHTGQIQKQLTIYELDFGLNHVVKKSSEPIPETAHMLLPVPGLPDGPGGVLIACEDMLIYKGNNQELKCRYPQRFSTSKIMINSFGFLKQKSKNQNLSFFLLQTELGDLFKLQIKSTDDKVHGLTLQYFDSIPTAISICITKTGHLFAACEKGDHLLYRFKSLGEQEERPTKTTSADFEQQAIFIPRKLVNLEQVDSLDNLSAISDIKVNDLTGEGNPQIYALCAAGSRSTLRILRHGLQVSEYATSRLPLRPNGIWTIKQRHDEGLTKYIVLSSSKKTYVLSIKDTISAVNDSSLDTNSQTLHAGILENNCIIQVTPESFRQIRDNRVTLYKTESNKFVKACSNSRQIALALQGGQGQPGGDIIYFEFDLGGQLKRIEEKAKLTSDIECIDIGEVPIGRPKFKFLAVGCKDQTVRILSLEQDQYLQRLSLQALPGIPESVSLIEMKRGTGTEQEAEEYQLYLFVGLQNGILLRATVDQVTGSLSDVRTRVLSAAPIRTCKYVVQGQPALLALSTRPWICYTYLGKYQMVPISYDMLEYAAPAVFNMQGEQKQCIVSTSGESVRIIEPQKYGDLLNQQVIKLRYSPRKMAIHERSHNIVLIESDNKVYNESQKKQLIEQYYSNQNKGDLATQVDLLTAPSGNWASCVRIVDPVTRKTLNIYELENNEHALSMCMVNFDNKDETYVCVGTVKDYQVHPNRNFSVCYINTFQLNEKLNTLELLHKTEIFEIPGALHAHKGKLLAGCGTFLRYYELGKKKLLKKAEIKGLQSPVNGIQTFGDRIYVSMVADSVHVLKYRSKDQTFYEVCDDILPRWMSSFQVLDYHTYIGGDKFENAFVCRVPSNADEEMEENPMAYKLRWETGYLNGAPFKTEQICHFYAGEVITTLQKASLVSTGNEIVLYGTSMGSIGAYLPFQTKEDIDFFIHLEMYLRLDVLPLAGRDHVMFRSFYGPVKSVIDGDLCEQFIKLSSGKQKVLADEMDRHPHEVHKKLDEIRNKIL
ncbi:splicing factor 3B subunit 3 (macronuclear) [Tetrahymena thermophila SB210]|uniref:Splicing factor 3B subunit 3 n=1 Tax=Tetrahymena thermophila (strain SB210) TaxID=312017 RepID=I7LTE1_TETTS|nr:splicing factor 3B subunit 3 [Tetrahymena thermophila SB210]EAR85077.1 splicing factor 3B subunit 3 [Tetrahymena thermophila SB210]|eukprot:XP_001032740.1 splicing factor 3B subunit 3 [Tetrahymena thermophila SB210]